MSKSIWIFNHYATNQFFEHGGRHYNFAKNMVLNGYDVTIFCANTIHNTTDNVDLNGAKCVLKETNGVKFVFIKAYIYNGNGVKRILNMVDFYFNLKRVAKECATQHGVPDVIYASSVHPLAIVAGIQLAKHFGIKCIAEIRDLWPESIVCYKGMSRKNPIIIALYMLEEWMYKRADRLIFTMEGGKDYIIERGWDVEHGGPVDLNKVYHINNGVDLEEFDYNKEHFTIDDEDLNDPNTFKVIYTGSIRRVNNIGIILDVAKSISDKSIKFLIWGQGDEVDLLQKRINEEQITNVVLKGFVEKKYVPYITTRSNLNLVHWEMADILKFGCSYNKLFDYLAAGKPIFSTVKTAYSLLDKYNCGIETKEIAINSFAHGIIQLRGASTEYCAQMGLHARKAAERYDFKNLTKQLINIIEEI